MKGGPSFIRLQHDILTTDAWLFACRSGAVYLLLDIWARHNGKNNGRIPYGQLEAMHRFGCSSKRAVRWFAELQEAGFIAVKQRGSFHQKVGTSAARVTRWRLTMEPCDGNPPTREYLSFVLPGESNAD